MAKYVLDPARTGKSDASLNFSKGFAFSLLFLSYAINQMDRTIISFLAVPIKFDLGLSDAQFGIITGPAFSIPYGIFSFLFAYYADRGNRVHLLAAFLAVWSLATFACGFAGSFLQLLLARLVVGIGEAGGTPTSMALVTDCVSKERLSSAYAIFLLASPCGILTAAVAGSYIAERYSWNVAFFVCGVFGLLAACVTKLKVRDPRMQTSIADRGTTIQRSPKEILVSIVHASKIMIRRRSVVLILFSYSFSQFVSMVLLNWAPIFLNRYHSLNVHDASLYLGIAFVCGLAPGLIVGGLVSDRLAQRSQLWMIHVPIISLSLATPLLLMAFYVADWPVALGVFALGVFSAQAGTGPTLAAFIATLPSQIRATGTAALLLGTTMISGGLGNLLVGVMSDQLVPVLGASSLHFVLTVITIMFGVISVIFLIMSRKYYPADLRNSSLQGEAMA